MEIEWHDDTRVTVTIHQSWMDTYAKCPEKARRGIESPSPPSDATTLGTGMHAACAAVLEGESDPHQSLRDAMFEEFAHPEFKWTGNGPQTKSQLISYASKLYECWEAEALPVLAHPVSVEHKFRIPIGTREIGGLAVTLVIEGTWDYEDENLMYDWKTASSLRAYGPQALRKAVQPTMYTLAHVLETGAPFSSVIPFRYGVVLKKAQPEFVWKDTFRHEGDWAWLIEQMWAACRLWVALPEGPWPLIDEGWICSAKWCQFWSDCKGKPRQLETESWNQS